MQKGSSTVQTVAGGVRTADVDGFEIHRHRRCAVALGEHFVTPDLRIEHVTKENALAPELTQGKRQDMASRSLLSTASALHTFRYRSRGAPLVRSWSASRRFSRRAPCVRSASCICDRASLPLVTRFPDGDDYRRRVVLFFEPTWIETRGGHPDCESGSALSARS